MILNPTIVIDANFLMDLKEVNFVFETDVGNKEFLSGRPYLEVFEGVPLRRVEEFIPDPESSSDSIYTGYFKVKDIPEDPSHMLHSFINKGEFSIYVSEVNSIDSRYLFWRNYTYYEFLKLMLQTFEGQIKILYDHTLLGQYMQVTMATIVLAGYISGDTLRLNHPFLTEKWVDPAMRRTRSRLRTLRTSSFAVEVRPYKDYPLVNLFPEHQNITLISSDKDMLKEWSNIPGSLGILASEIKLLDPTDPSYKADGVINYTKAIAERIMEFRSNSLTQTLEDGGIRIKKDIENAKA